MVAGKKFVEGLAWNYISIFILAISGFVFNVLIELFYGIETVGIFNQIYAYYIVFSQISVLGLHNSVLKYVSSCENGRERWKILKNGIILTWVVSCIFALIVFLVAYALMEGTTVQNGMMAISVALPFFSVNKVYLNFFNACSKMKEYAVFQALRSIFIAVSIIGLYLLGMSSEDICVCFTLSEILLFTLMFTWSRRYKVNEVGYERSLLKQHIIFGSKVFLANVVMDLNTKIDILCMGWILRDDMLIGVYSFAVIFAEGFYQLYIVLRRSINPQLAKDKDKRVLCWIQHNSGKILAVSLAMTFVALGGFYFICCVTSTEYLKGILPLGIILMGISCNSKYIILGNYWSQQGQPFRETMINVITVGSNLFLNVVLIKALGMIGAAIATTISYFVFSIALGIGMKVKV